MIKNWCLLSYFRCTQTRYVAYGVSDLLKVSFVSELKSPRSALIIEALRSSVSLASSQEIKKSCCICGLRLHIFSPNSTLLCWYNLLVMRFPQFVTFWIMPSDCLILSRIQSSPKRTVRISGVSRQIVQSHFFNFPYCFDLALGSSHRQHVEIGNDSHECICSKTCNHGMSSIITLRHLSTCPQ